MGNIGLVLSGGMVKGAYQIGALQAIAEFFKPSDFRYVSAASIGALNSYAFLTNRVCEATALWQASSESTRRKVTSIFKADFLREAISKIVTDVQFNNTFFIPLLNIKRRKLSYVDIGKIQFSEVEPYLRASVALPILNSAVQIDGEAFYDGAMIDNIPIYPILKHSVDYIVCVYFDNNMYTFEDKCLDNKIIKINFSDSSIISNSICLKNEEVDYMIREGYSRAKMILDYIFTNGMNDVELIHKKISELNSLNKGRNVRITGDVVVNNMNKIVRKFMNRIEIY